MTPSQIIVLATPVFFALIAIEFAVGRARGRNPYRLDDAITSIGLGMLSQISAVFTVALRFGLYTAVFGAVALVPDNGFWTSPVGWLLALVFYDFLYYWNHRLGHTCALFWAAHVVHHQSEDYNLSTALRQTSSGALFGWVFYLPMAVAGVPPLVFGVVGLIDLLYQYWIHTQQIGRLGRFDRWFASPSNHRVHHAVNDRYVDTNYGGILMLWDHLFGSFEDENPDEPCVYGTRSPLRSWDPLWANTEVYAALWRESRQARRWGDKLRVWLKPPGWQSADMAAHSPKAPFNITQVRTFSPPLSTAVRRFAAVHFAVLLAGAGVFLWFTDGWPLWQSGVWFVVLLAGLWSLGAVVQGRLGILEALMVQSGALSMATATTSATGLFEWHGFFKVLTMVIAIALVLRHGRAKPSTPLASPWLTLALVGSLLGDAFLVGEGYFILGLASFLLAHLAYIAHLRRDVPWLQSPTAWAACAAIGVAFYSFLWHSGLPVGLRLPVAIYVMAICTMGAVAIGRAVWLGDTPARLVALGALFFMVSDATLAVNRFVSPLPHAPVWVLCTYYAAQCLIVMGLLRSGQRPIR